MIFGAVLYNVVSLCHCATCVLLVQIQSAHEVFKETLAAAQKRESPILRCLVFL